MTGTPTAHRPIGWWLKRADTQLESAFDRALKDTDVDRRRWQLLTLLTGGPASRALPGEDYTTLVRLLERLADGL